MSSSSSPSASPLTLNSSFALPATLGFLAGSAMTLALGSLVARYRDRSTTTDKPEPEPSPPLDAEAHLWKIVQYSFSGALIRAGDKLGIYEKLHNAKRTSATELATQNGWSARWVREFLMQAASAGICSYHKQDGGTKELEFSLNPDYAPFLRQPSEERMSLAGMFQLLLPLLNRSDAVVKAIQSGVGVDYDWAENHADDIVVAMDRKNRNWFTHSLVDDVLSTIIIPSTGVPLLQMLSSTTAGPVRIADVGCGCGASSIALAKRFPHAHVFAYESSERAIGIFQRRIQEEGISNITICDVAERTVGDGPCPSGEVEKEKNVFDFVYAHDVVHDMTNPKALIRDVYHRLSDRGCWVIVDIDCSDDEIANLENPSAATMYGFSCFLCLACSSSTKDGAALGVCGFPPTLAKKWMDKAGFHHMVNHSVKTILPRNSCFIVAK